MRRFFSVILSLSLLVLITSCDMVSPEFKDYQNLQFSEISGEKLVFSVDVTAMNPNKQNITVRKSTFDVYLDDGYIGKVSLLTPYKMPKETTVTQTIDAEVYLEKGMLFYVMGKAFKRNTKVRLEGRLKAKVSGILVSRKINETREIDLSVLGRLGF